MGRDEKRPTEHRALSPAGRSPSSLQTREENTVLPQMARIRRNVSESPLHTAVYTLEIKPSEKEVRSAAAEGAA